MTRDEWKKHRNALRKGRFLTVNIGNHSVNVGDISSVRDPQLFLDNQDEVASAHFSVTLKNGKTLTHEEEVEWKCLTVKGWFRTRKIPYKREEYDGSEGVQKLMKHWRLVLLNMASSENDRRKY